MNCSRCGQPLPATRKHRYCTACNRAYMRARGWPHGRRRWSKGRCEFARHDPAQRCHRVAKFERYCAQHRNGELLDGPRLIKLAVFVAHDVGDGTDDDVHEALVAAMRRLRNPKPMTKPIGAVLENMRWAIRSAWRRREGPPNGPRVIFSPDPEQVLRDHCA